ncbi:protein of unknown function [Burkholderia multivorans]
MQRDGEERCDDRGPGVLRDDGRAQIGLRERAFLIERSRGDRRDRQHRYPDDEPCRHHAGRRGDAARDFRREHERDAREPEQHAEPAAHGQFLVEERHGERRGRERLQRAEQRHHARVQALGNRPVARAEIHALQQRAGDQVAAPFASGRPRRARGQRECAEQQCSAGEAREQEQIGICVRLDRARDDEAGGPERDKRRGDDQVEHAKRPDTGRTGREVRQYPAVRRRSLVENCTCAPAGRGGSVDREGIERLVGACLGGEAGVQLLMQASGLVEREVDPVGIARGIVESFGWELDFKHYAFAIHRSSPLESSAFDGTGSVATLRAPIRAVRATQNFVGVRLACRCQTAVLKWRATSSTCRSR